MRWFKPNIRTSLYGLLGNPGPSDSDLDSAQDGIRDSMLDLLGPSGLRQFPHVVRRIRYADGSTPPRSAVGGPATGKMSAALR